MIFRKKKDRFRVELQWTFGGSAQEVVIWAVVFGPMFDPYIGEWIEIARGRV